MEILVRQNWDGKYRLFSNDITHVFILDIIDDDGKTIEIDRVKCRLYWEGEVSESDVFKDPLDNISDIYIECLKYSDKVISSVDYLQQCINFFIIYNQNFENIDCKILQKKKSEAIREIERLNKILNYSTYLQDPDDIKYELKSHCDKKINTYNGIISRKEKELKDILIGSDKYNEISKYIDKYRQLISNLESLSK